MVGLLRPGSSQPMRGDISHKSIYYFAQPSPAWELIGCLLPFSGLNTFSFSRFFYKSISRLIFVYLSASPVGVSGVLYLFCSFMSYTQGASSRLYDIRVSI